MQTPMMDPRLMQSVDVGGMVRQGIEAGQAEKKQREISEAMQALVANPNDPAAVQGIARHDPRLAMQIQGQQQQSLQQRLERDRDNIIKGGQIFRQLGVKDEATYQQARAMAAQMGMDVSQVPPNFDERYVQGVVSLADTFAPQKAEGQPNIAKEVEYYRSIGRPDLAEQRLLNHANPQIGVQNPDGTYTLMRPPLPGVQANDEDEWEYMPPANGGPTPQASGTFQP
jgi:hypothetical protein